MAKLFLDFELTTSLDQNHSTIQPLSHVTIKQLNN
jgi:hypothetical protein